MKKGINIELNKALAPIRRRIVLRTLIRMAGLGFAAALLQALIWMIASFFIPIYDLEVKMAAAGGVIFAAFCLVGFIMRPTIAKIAREVDANGLEERVTTALELYGREDVFAQLQRRDTIEELNSFDPKSISIRISKSRLISIGSLVVALIAMFLIPNPQDEFIKKQLQIEKAIQEQAEKLEEHAEEELAEEEELQQILKDLAQKLKEVKDYRLAIKELTRSEEQLIEIMRKAQEAKMAELGEKLSKRQATQSLGQMIKEMDEQGIAEEMERLKELTQGEKMDEEIMEALQKALEEIAEQLADSALKSSMMEAANAIAANLSSGSDLSAQALENLKDQLMQMAKTSLDDPGNIMYMLQNMKGKIAQAAGQDISNLASAEAGQQGSQSSSGNQGSENGSEGQSSSNGGNSGGQGNLGSGINGEGGSGNSGSSGSGAGTDGAPAGGQGSGIGSGHTEYERIYDPERLGDGGEVSQVTGNAGNEGDSEQVNAGQGVGNFNGFIPYNEVFGEYKSQAMQNLDRMDIPPNMREWIKSYFSSLEE